MKLPTVVITSVIRSSKPGDSHGAVYLVDLEDESFEQVIDWDFQGINWRGRGGERGLRGIVFYRDKPIIVDTDTIYFFNRDWEITKQFTNCNLGKIHEIDHRDHFLYITSAENDCIVKFDIQKLEFEKTFFLQSFRKIIELLPQRSVDNFMIPRYHLNMVKAEEGGFWYSDKTTNLLCFYNEKVGRVKNYMQCPEDTHNAQPFRNGLICNNTGLNRIQYITDSDMLEFEEIQKYPEQELENAHLDEKIARQAFARGLDIEDNIVVGGSSPVTVSAYNFQTGELIKRINISKDIRKAVHGLKIDSQSLKG